MSIMQFMLAHPYLFGALGIVLILIMVMEVQRARRLGGGVDAATAVRLINREDAWVLDVRDVAAFKQGHIIEARNIPEARLDESLSSLESQKGAPGDRLLRGGQPCGVGGRTTRSRRFFPAVASARRVARMAGGRTPLGKTLNRP